MTKGSWAACPPAAVMLWCALAAPSAEARASTHHFDIPAGQTANALTVLGDQAGVQLLYNPQVVQGRRSPRLAGTFTVDEALGILLAGTSLQYEIRDSGVAVITLKPAVAPPAVAVGAASKPAAPEPPTEVLVTGMRDSVLSAAKMKQAAGQISDYVYAEDIGKLPDSNTAEALQRLTGVQITRANGSGVGVEIRGLSQIVAELNGRPIFSAGIKNEGTPSRSLNFEDLPADLVARVEVVKTATADQVEGGIGGTVDFVTPHPLNFLRPRYGYSIKDTYSPSANSTQFSYSTYYVKRFDTPVGPLGVWVSLGTDRHRYRTDWGYWDTTPIILNSIALQDGSIITGPVIRAGTSFVGYEYGLRTRTDLNVSLEWQPAANLQASLDINRSENLDDDTAEHRYSDYGTTTDPITGLKSVPSMNKAEVVETPIGIPFLQSATAVMTPHFGSFIDTKRGITTQVATALSWHAGKWEDHFEAYYVQSEFDSLFNQIDTAVPSLTETYDFGGRFGAIAYPGANLMDLANYTITKLNFGHQHDIGVDAAARFDFQYKFDGVLRLVKFGVRVSDRIAKFTGNNPVMPLDLPAMDYVSLFRPTRFDDLYGHKDSDNLSAWMVPNTDQLKDPQTIFSQFGEGAVPGPDPRQAFIIREHGTAGYVRTDYGFSLGPYPADGNLGVRIVRTQTIARGPQVDATTGTVEAISRQVREDTAILPSFNLRVRLNDVLQMRLAASKAISRPDLNLLNPALFIQYNFGSATAGNPDLKPLKADQFDATLEYNFSRHGALTAGAFYKSVIDFPETLISAESINGQPFQVSRPRNAACGWIRGAEFSYQQTYDFLPGALGGLGLLANATLIDSSAPDGFGGTGRLPLMSKTNYNLIFMYEHARLSARLAYNWRSDYPTAYSVLNDRRYPTLQAAYGQMDAAVNFSLTKHIVVFLEATNLQNAPSYTTFAGLNGGAAMTDRRWIFGLRWKN